MFAAIDWNEVLMKAQMGAVLGGVGGACAGLIAYLARKPDDKKQAEAEARERTRTYAKASTANTKSRWPVLLTIVAVVVACALVANPSLVAPFLRVGSERSQPSATISDYGRYRVKGPIRVAPDRNMSGDVVVIGDPDLILLEQTDQIPCRVGETWGIQIRCSDVPANRPYTVRKEIHHPPIKQSDGSIRTKSVGEFKLRPGVAFNQFCGWYFLKDYEYELVAGEWTIVVFIDDVEVARKVFNIQK